MTQELDTNGIDRQDLDVKLRTALEGFNRHDADAFTSVMTEDVELRHSALPSLIVGRDAVKRAYADTFWTAFPDQTLELTDGPYFHASAPRVAVTWTVRGTHEGLLDPPGLHATGRVAEFVVRDFFELRDGKISRFDVTVDVADILRQLGVLPPSGSGLERGLMQLDRVRTLRGRILKDRHSS